MGAAWSIGWGSLLIRINRREPRCRESRASTDGFLKWRRRERSVGRNVMRKEWNSKGMEFRRSGRFVKNEKKLVVR